MAKQRDTRLTGRANAANQFRQPLKRFRDSLAESRELWDRLEPEQREAKALEEAPSETGGDATAENQTAILAILAKLGFTADGDNWRVNSQVLGMATDAITSGAIATTAAQEIAGWVFRLPEGHAGYAATKAVLDILVAYQTMIVEIEGTGNYQFLAPALATAPQPTIPTPPTPSAIATEVYAAGRVFPAANLANAPAGAGSATITVLPYTGTAAGTGRLTSHDLVVYQHAKLTVSLGVYDRDGEPVNLAGKSLAFVAYSPNDATMADFTLADLSAGGSDGNTVSVTIPTTQTAMPRSLRWILRNLTDDLALMIGTLQVLQAPTIPTTPS